MSIVSFRPWLAGGRDALIRNLFGELSKTLNDVALEAGNAAPAQAASAREASQALRRFINGLSRTGTAIETFGEFSGIGGAIWLGRFLKALREASRPC